MWCDNIEELQRYPDIIVTLEVELSVQAMQGETMVEGIL